MYNIIVGIIFYLILTVEIYDNKTLYNNKNIIFNIYDVSNINILKEKNNLTY